MGSEERWDEIKHERTKQRHCRVVAVRRPYYISNPGKQEDYRSVPFALDAVET